MRPSSRVLQGFLQLGRYNYAKAMPPLRQHRHHRAVEICFLIKGRQAYRVGEELFLLRGGDIFLTFPDEVHSSGGTPEGKGILYWMELAMPNKGESLFGLPTHEGRALGRALLSLRRRHFRGSCRMAELLDAMTLLFHQPNRALRSCEISNRAVALILEVIACERTSAAPRPIRRIDPALNYIAENLGEPLTVGDLAKLTGLSEARFKVRFKQELGVPPGEYVQRTRIEEAQRRLERGSDSVTRIAFDLGFSSSQYFATVFRRFTGKSPRKPISSIPKTR